MAQKYQAGEAVAFRDPRALGTDFIVVQRMPGEDNASEARYKIKSAAEGFERVVAESALEVRVVDAYAWKLAPKVKRELPKKAH